MHGIHKLSELFTDNVTDISRCWRFTRQLAVDDETFTLYSYVTSTNPQPQ